MTRTVWRRAFAFTSALLFVLSWIFPLGAGLAKDTSLFPKWWGGLDVALAFVVAISAFGIQAMVYKEVDTQAKEATYRFFRIFTHAIMGVGVVVILAGDRIIWVNCATGFLWRTWLLLYILPWWLAAARPPEIRAFH